MLGLKKHVLFLACLIIPFIAPHAYGAPKAVIGQLAFDAGEIPQGRKIVHVFPIKNTGDEALTINAKPC